MPGSGALEVEVKLTEWREAARVEMRAKAVIMWWRWWGRTWAVSPREIRQGPKDGACEGWPRKQGFQTR